jgi:hypothetical protein
MSRWRTPFLLTLLAAFSFGGSFECRGSTHDDGPAEPASTPLTPRR